MKLCKLIAAVLAAALLCGCSGKQPEEQITESLVWETMPALNVGTLEYEKLEALPWYCGRTEMTSFYRMAETEMGFYAHDFYWLKYADKANLPLWVPVCRKPGCVHAHEGCSAYVSYEPFVVKGDRIYVTKRSYGLKEFYTGDAHFFLMSMDRDGQNQRFAYAFERRDPASTPRSIKTYVCPYGYFYSEYVLNTDGTHTSYVYRVTEDGTETVLTDSTGTEYMEGHGSVNFNMGIFGDRLLILGVTDALEPEYTDIQIYRLLKDELVPLDAPYLPMNKVLLRGSYLSGDILRYYRRNDGYYDLNIKTGEEIKVADAQLQDAGVYIPLPNCILETTLGWENQDGEGIPHSMGQHYLKLFDGERWRDVKLPEELRTADAGECLSLTAVTSDKIILGSYNIFQYRTRRSSPYYAIDLTQEELSLEYIYEWTY